MRRALTLTLSLLLLVSSLSGCSAQHWRYEELSFTLPADFQNRSAEGFAADFDFLFENGTVAVAGIRETKQALSGFGPIDANAYTQLVIQYNGLTCQPVQNGDLLCFSYEAVSGGVPMTYLCAVHEAEHSFWQVQAYCKTADFPVQEKTMWGLITSMDTE